MQNEKKNYVIVVGIDYASGGDLALEQAMELANEHEPAEVHVVYVARTLGPLVQFEVPSDARGVLTQSLSEAAEHLRMHIHGRVEEYKDKRKGRVGKRFERVIPHLRLDAPAEEIAQLASDLDADLVVVGTHGRRGMRRLLLGSVAESVVRLAPCPVLVVRPKELPSAPKIEPPCPHCVETRKATGGTELWCEQHRERHGQRHTYHQGDRAGNDTNFPLTFHT